MTRTPGARAALACGVAAAALLALAGPAAQAATACDVGDIEALNIEGVTVVSATAVAAAGVTPAYCDVIAQLNTTGWGAPDGSAGFEVRLPADWNKKFLFFGVGGLAGSTYADLAASPFDEAEALPKGYATAITDTGHLAGNTDASWSLTAPGVPDQAKLTDYYFRATHEVTVAAKQLVAGFYAGTVAESYFDGCSNGGRQAMMEAAYFYDDYDGIIVGDPFFDIRTIVNGVKIAKQGLTAETYVPASLLPVIDAAVNASCDAADGVKDGLIQNPAACSFNPYTLVCAPGQTADCLSEGQAATIDTYFTATRKTTGGLVYPGYAVTNLSTSATGPLEQGGADAWTFGFVPPTSFTAREPWGEDGFGNSPYGYQFADHITQDIVELDPTYNTRDFGVSADGFVPQIWLDSFNAGTQAGDAYDPAAYEQGILKTGKKLIIYHGYSDPALTPFRTINLYEKLAHRVGGYSALQDSARLFLVPGMHHCVGGPGPNAFDTLTPLEQWVEKGVAPAAITATHYVNDDPTKAADRTMPLCPFPTEATYAGAGDVDSAANWSCKANKKLLQTGTNGVQAGADSD
jgi:feruloyl esterase